MVVFILVDISVYPALNKYFVKPVIKRMNTNIDTASWYESYVSLRILGANDRVKSNMIYGCLWDETLQWLVDTGNKTFAELYNSDTWGNHQDGESFTHYTDVSGNTRTKSGKIPTGSTERNKANNIIYVWFLRRSI